MYLSNIVPVPQTEWMVNQPIIMSLSHLIEKYPRYREMLKNRPKDSYLMVDNSIIEMGSSFSMERIYNNAKSVDADEIILEDAYPDGPETINAIKRSLKWLKDNNHLGEFKIQAVCHGRNLEEFVNTFNFINNCPEIDTIGIPKVLSVWCGERKNLAPIFTKTSKNIHYLGSWYSLKELSDLNNDLRSKIRSCDTCLICAYVIQNKNVLETRDGTIDLEKDYPELTYDKYVDKLKEFEAVMKL